MISQRIQDARESSAASEIKTLDLKNCETTEIHGISGDEFTSLKSLILAENKLQTLKGFPSLTSLVHLDLSNNELVDGWEYLAMCKGLQSLKLSKNKIATVDALKSLAECSQLTDLDITDCEVTCKEGYRQAVVEAIPSLVLLNGLDVNGASKTEEGDASKGDKVQAASVNAAGDAPK